MQKMTMQNFNTECNEALKEISLSVSKSFSVEQTEQGCMVHTPFYDPDRDQVSVLLKEKDNKIILTDMGESVGYLFLHGLDLKPDSKFKRLFDISLRKLSIRFIDGELTVIADKDNLADAVLQMIEGILAIEHLTYTARNRKHAVFRDDVQEWLTDIKADYVQTPSYDGISGKRFSFDFEIHRQEKEQILMYALHSETPTYAKMLVNKVIVSFLEVRDAGAPFVSACLLDDTTEEDAWEGQLNLLKGRVDRIAFWDEREDLTAELVA